MQFSQLLLASVLALSVAALPTAAPKAFDLGAIVDDVAKTISEDPNEAADEVENFLDGVGIDIDIPEISDEIKETVTLIVDMPEVQEIIQKIEASGIDKDAVLAAIEEKIDEVPGLIEKVVQKVEESPLAKDILETVKDSEIFKDVVQKVKEEAAKVAMESMYKGEY